MLSFGLLVVALVLSAPVHGDIVAADLEAVNLTLPDSLIISEFMSNFCLNLTVKVNGADVRLLEGDTFQTHLQLIGEGYLHLRSQTLNFSVSHIEHKTRFGVKDGTTLSAIGTTFSMSLGDWICAHSRLLCLEVLAGPKIEDKNKENNWICRDIRERMKCASTTPKKLPSCKMPAFPEFLKRPHGGYANINDTIVFECAIKPKRAKKIEWYFDDAPIQQGDPAFMNTWLYPGGALMLSPVGPHHVGQYKCVATDWSGNSIKAEGYLEDKTVACNEMMVEKPLNRTLKAGRPVLLNCMAENADTVTWYKDGQLLQESANRKQLTYGQLLIKSISKSDDGVYECVAKRGGLTCAYKSTIRVFVNADEICGLPVLNQPIPLDSSTRQTGFIVAGNDAPDGSSPWQAMLWFKGATLPRNKKGVYLERDFCAGVLIDDQWVVTAAHCIESLRTAYSHTLRPSDIMVRLGKRYRDRTESHERNMSVVAFVTKDFRAQTFDNDIALLKLSEHVEFSDHIRPICLGDAAMKRPHRDALITGWGRVSNHGSRPPILQQVTIPIRNRTECRRSTTQVITTNMFCAGEGRHRSGDACRGDSGGPLSVREGRKWYLLGLISWGEGCSRPGSYGFYTNIVNYKPWIHQKTI